MAIIDLKFDPFPGKFYGKTLEGVHMFAGQLIFKQVMDFMPLPIFRRCVAKYHGEHRMRKFSCLDQFLCMAFAQVTYRESLRDIKACLRSQQKKLYHRVSVAEFPNQHSPTPTKSATGGSMRSKLSILLPLLASCTKTIRSATIWTKPSTP